MFSGSSTATRATCPAASARGSQSGARSCPSRNCVDGRAALGLDREAKDEILAFLERCAPLKLPVVYVSHDVAEVERLADQLVLMEKGRVIGAGMLEELQSDPSLPLAAARDAAVSFDGVVEASDKAYGLLTLKIRGGSLTVPAPLPPLANGGASASSLAM